MFQSFISRGVQRLIPRHLKVNLTTPAVTEVIEDALRRRLELEKLPILHTASRTDAGVHALRTAASVDLDLPKLHPDVITVTLNHYFNKIQVPIRILSTQVVKPDFYCRGLPLYRSYLYRFAVQRRDSGFESDFSFTHLVPTPISEYKRCHFVHDPEFNVEAVQSVLPLFNGVQDFASFKSKQKGKKELPPVTTIRRLDSVILERGQPLMPGYFTDKYFDYWQVKIVGKSFLYKQVRRTVAVLLGVGQGSIDYKDVESLFVNPGSWFDGLRSVPSHGLYLTDVVYSKEDLEVPVGGGEFVPAKEFGEEVGGGGEGEEEEGEEEEGDRREERSTSTLKVESPSVKVESPSVKVESPSVKVDDIPKVKVTAEVKVATSTSPKETSQLSINEKINLRLAKLRQETPQVAEKRKLSTRYAIWLAKSKYAKGLEEI